MSLVRLVMAAVSQQYIVIFSILLRKQNNVTACTNVLVIFSILLRKQNNVTARHIVGGELPSLQDIYTRRCTRKARRIIKDSSHPSHRLLSLLPSGRCFRSIRSRTSRLRDSFFPQAIRLMNSHK